jgi:hypothetical protein
MRTAPPHSQWAISIVDIVIPSSDRHCQRRFWWLKRALTDECWSTGVVAVNETAWPVGQS